MAIADNLVKAPIRWEIDPAYREALLGSHGLRLDEWLANGQAHIVKQGPHRTVYRVEIPELTFYLKHNRLPNARAWLRSLVRPSKARMEYDRAIAIASRGIPTISPLGFGEAPGWKPAESWLITQALEDVQPLSSFLENTFTGLPLSRQTRLRQRISRCLATLLAHMHDAGVCHNDLHAGNLLIRLDEAEEPHLYLVDLHAVKIGRSLSWRASRDNLVLLNQWFSMRAHRADRLRFWRTYAQARNQSWPSRSSTELDESGRDLERLTWNSNLRFWRHRDGRCVVDNRYYRRLVRTETSSQPGVCGLAVTDMDDWPLESLLQASHKFFTKAGNKVLKDSPSSTVMEMEITIQGFCCPVIYKRFIATPTWRDWFADKFRRAPALTSWVNGHGLRERCLPTPRPLAIFQLSRGSTNGDAFLLTVKIPSAVNLREYVMELGQMAALEGRPLIRKRIDQLARLVREMHRRHVSHRDLKATNILVEKPGSTFPRLNADFGPFWLIDLVGVRMARHLFFGRIVQNLARLNASFPHPGILTRSDKLRFLRVYQQWGLFGRSRWKAWWRAIDKATQAKVHRNLLNGRPLA